MVLSGGAAIANKRLMEMHGMRVLGLELLNGSRGSKGSRGVRGVIGVIGVTRVTGG